MSEPPHIDPCRKEMYAAALLVELLQPGAWIPPGHARWLPVIEALLEAFLRHFDRAVLAQFWITSAPFRHPHQPLRARREWRGN